MNAKKLLLGTAQWGWTVSKSEAFRQLDFWLAAGQLAVDVATNYPINKNPSDFRAAEGILLEYIRAHGLRNLDVTVKIGSMDNMRTPDINLAPSFVLLMAEEYRRLFADNLRGVMLHWDNRTDVQEIRETLQALAIVQQQMAVRPGISGIQSPEIYAQISSELELQFDIQLKHNVLHSDLPRYVALSRKNHRWFAYGINAGGLKLDAPYPTGSTFLARGGDPEKASLLLQKIRNMLPTWNTAFVRPPVRTLNHVGLLFAGLHPLLDGLVLGFSSANQLAETLDFWRNIETFEYTDVFSGLSKIVN